MASGKSTIGRALAERLDWPFVDTDRSIEQALRLSISEIFARHGEAEFRRIERELVFSLFDSEARVIAGGGGVFANRALRQILNRETTTVWLDAPFALIVKRLAQSIDRPLASGRCKTELRQLWEARLPSYATAHVRIKVSEADPFDTVERIIEAIG
jgi:shikimate kinase